MRIIIPGIALLIAFCTLLMAACSGEASKTNSVQELAPTVIGAYQLLDEETIKRHSAPMFRDMVPADLSSRRKWGTYGQDFKILADTLVRMNNVHYFLVEYGNGKKEVFGFSQYEDTKDWFINPVINGNPFMKPRGK